MESSFHQNEHNSTLKRWRFFVACWPILCILFAVIIVCQPSRGAEERISDAAFTIIPLIFFAIGMRIRRRILRERTYASALTTATVVSIDTRIHVDNNSYFPEYEFQVGETTYHVKSPSGYNTCRVSKGSQVELYYNPQNPKLFYVPAMQKSDNRWAILLCSVGIIGPLMGLFAPQIRALASFLQ